MIGPGTAHVIEQLGAAHQAALAEIERLAQENAQLRAALAGHAD